MIKIIACTPSAFYLLIYLFFTHAHIKISNKHTYTNSNQIVLEKLDRNYNVFDLKVSQYVKNKYIQHISVEVKMKDFA